MFQRINWKKINDYDALYALYLLSILSLIAFFVYFQDGTHLIYADAISRLNIARKVIDNITPGLPQLGNVWLPLPQILMLPFIWNKDLWHSGIAGYLMSGSMFVIGGFFIYKSAKLISNSILASLFSLGIYALNINILYLQSTAMSESIFLCTLSMTIYFFLRWFYTKNDSNLMLAAFSVSMMTLIRYEGLAILLSSIPMVFLYSYLRDKKLRKAEGNTILYSTLAVVGFGLWTVYLTVIFGDPLYWRTYYATAQATGDGSIAFTQAKSFFAATWQYFTSFVWMVGVIPAIYTIIAIVIISYTSIKNKSYYFLPLFMPLSIFLFMVLTLMRNTPIVQPDLSLQNILSGTTSYGVGFNIRYGLLLLPWVAILSAYLFRAKYLFVKVLLFLIFAIQVYSYFQSNVTLIYQIPHSIREKPYAKATEYLKKNYDGGKILISAGSEEDQMFLMGFDYKTYIHEGAGKYWKESLDNPSRYARWIVIEYGDRSDNLARNMKRDDILEREYKVVYEEPALKIFKKNTKPYYEIP